MGFKPKVLQKKICKYCIREGEKEIQKRVKQILASLKSDWNVIVQDEFIFVHDYVIRRKKWISENKRPVVTVTAGSRKKTIVFGSLSLDGKQLFKQYDEFNNKTFVDYLKHIQKRFRKIVVFVDRAAPHYSKITRKFLDANKNIIRLEEYFPVGFPEFNAVEECWRQEGKYHILFTYYPLFDFLKDTILYYYRITRFNLDIVKYLMRTID